MSEHTSVVTGANRGLGLWTAWHLARRGGRVGLVCRDGARAAAARAFLLRSCPSAQVDIWLADMSSVAAVRSVAQSIAEAYPVLDVLVNNAGAVFGPRQLSVDGVEMHLATNYLGAFLLTARLLERLIESGDGRVLNLTSFLHRVGKIRFHDLHRSRWYHLVPAYAQSKLAIVLATLEMARRARHLPLAINCVDPGLTRTSIAQGAGPIQRHFARPVDWLGKEPRIAAEPIAALALEPAFKGVSGQYFVRDRPRRPSRRARNARTCERWWEQSCSWLLPAEAAALGALLRA